MWIWDNLKQYYCKTDSLVYRPTNLSQDCVKFSLELPCRFSIHTSMVQWQWGCGAAFLLDQCNHLFVQSIASWVYAVGCPCILCRGEDQETWSLHKRYDNHLSYHLGHHVRPHSLHLCQKFEISPSQTKLYWFHHDSTPMEGSKETVKHCEFCDKCKQKVHACCGGTWWEVWILLYLQQEVYHGGVFD